MKPLVVGDLEQFEKLYLLRKRQNNSQIEMAVSYGVCLGQYLSMESGDGPGRTPYVTLREISAQESAITHRRRKKWTRLMLARASNMSYEEICTMESGQTPSAALEKFWENYNEVG